MSDTQTKPLLVSLATFAVIFVLVFLFTLSNPKVKEPFVLPSPTPTPVVQIATPSATVKTIPVPKSSPAESTPQAGQSAQPATHPVINITNTTQSSSEQSAQPTQAPVASPSPSSKPGLLDLDLLKGLGL